MSWTKQDQYFLSLLHEFGERYIDSEFQKANEWVSSSSTSPALTLFGEYSMKKRAFVWKNKMNQISYKMAKEHYFSVFHSIPTIPKLFSSSVSLPHQWALIIPYLVKLMNAAFHVVIMKEKNRLLFYLVKIPLEDKIPFEVFEQMMSIYRLRQAERKAKHKTKRKMHSKRKTATKTTTHSKRM